MSYRSYYRWHAVLPALILFCSTAGAEESSQAIQQNIDDLIRTNSCVGCDLRGADLNRMILIDADLSNADLSGATFYLADLSGANLSGANLRDAKFGGADLANADLRGADLRGALLDGAFLKGSLMDGKVVEATAKGPDVEVEASEKVYIPDESKPKEVIDQNQAALAEPVEKVEDVASQKAEVEQDREMDDTADVIEQKQDDDSVGTASTATAAATSFSAAEERPKELMDQKKSVATDESVKAEAAAAVSQPGQAPPVKSPAPVKEAQVEGLQQSTPLQSDAAKPGPEEAEPVAQVDMRTNEKVQETTPVEKIATAPQEQQETGAEAEVTGAVAVEAMVEKLLDTNRCYECNLAGVDLSGEDLSGSDLEGSDLSGAILNDTDLAGTNLKGVSLRGAQMRSADLRRADLYKADLSGADLTEADFRGALIDEADFNGAIGYQPSLMVE